MTLVGWYDVKLFVEHASGVSMDALHILVGFLLFLIAALVCRRGIGSILPWLLVLVLELINEAYDLHVERWPNLARQIGEGVKDVMLTMALPTLILLIGRWKPQWLLGAGQAASGQTGLADD